MKKNKHTESLFDVFSKGVLIKFLLIFMLLLSFEGHATHYRYGNISWSRVNSTTRTVTVTVTQAWRRSFYGAINVGNVVPTNVTLAFGDGLTTPINLTATSVNVTDDWFYGTFTVVHTYAGTTNVFNISYSSTARISTLQNNANGSFSSLSTVNLVTANTGSPVSSTPPIINLPIGQAAAAFNIPASDPDGGILTYGLATLAQTSATNPAGLAINSAGNATFNTVGKLVGQLWQAAFVVTDANGSNTIVDFMMLMVAANTPPVFDYSVTPANSTVFSINPGQNIHFTIKALDVDVGSTVTLSAVGLPTSNFTFSPGLPTTANPVSSFFNFTPTSAQLGIYIITFTATRNGGVQTSTTVTINVNTNPQFISPTKLEATNYMILSGVLNVDTIKASNPDPAVNTRITSGTIPAGATMSPTLPTALSTTPTTQMSWTPTPADFGVHNVSFLATDANGRTATRNYVLEVNTVPVFDPKSDDNASPCVLYNYNIAVNDPDIPYGDDVEIVDAGTLPSWLTLTHTGNGTATLSGTPSNADAGTYAISIAAEDLYHHVTGIPTQSFNITVLPDTTPPDSPLLADYIGGECSGTPPTPTTTDNCAGTLTGSTTTTFPITNQGTTIVTWIFNDGNGNATTVNQNVMVNDITPPNVTTSTGALNANLECSDASGLADALALVPSATDNCTLSPTLNLVSDTTDNSINPSCPNEYLRVRTWNFTDAVNNTSTNFEQRIHVRDTTPPTMHTKNATVYLDASGDASITVSDIDDGSTDNCSSMTYQLSNNSFNCGNLGSNTVTLTITDACGNSSHADASVTVIDALPPVTPTLPDVLLGECSGIPTAPTTTDNCAGLLTGVTSSTGSIKDQGTTVVSWRFDDGNGNVTVVNQNFIIHDVTPPTLTPGANQNVNLDNLCKITVPDVRGTATDNCSGITVTQDPAAGTEVSSVHNGTVNVTVTATDGVGLTDVKTVVLTAKDITPPTLTPAANQNVNLDSSCAITIPNVKGTATDSCSSTVITQVPASGTVLSSSHNTTINVTVTATDAAGNTDVKTVVLTAKDLTPPTLTPGNNQNVNLNSSCAVVIPNVKGTATDNCSSAVITQVPNSGALVSSSHNAAINVTVTATDAAGNTDVKTVVLTAKDVTPPTIVCPSNIVLNACQSTATWTPPSGNDNCSGLVVTQTAGGAPGSSFAAGTTTTISYKATDLGGNQAICTFNVTRAPALNLTVDNSNAQLYYGYTLDQTTVIKGTPSGGVGPYTVVITMNRILACNVLNSTGDEKWIPSAGTTTGNTCPTSGPGIIPVSTASIAAGGALSVTTTLLANATITVTVTDANGCSTSKTTNVYAEDARCFAGNSGISKVKICHRTGNTSDPCHEICVSEEAVAAHLAHGDYLGACLPNCATPIVRKVANLFDVVAYPNPSKHNFTIEIMGDYTEKIEVEVYDMLSRLVRHIESNDNQPISFGDNLPSGTYITRVTQGNNQKIIKVIKE